MQAANIDSIPTRFCNEAFYDKCLDDMIKSSNINSERYFDPTHTRACAGMWRIKPTHFIEDWVSNVPYAKVTRPIRELKESLQFSSACGVKTIAVWLIRKKEKHSPLYLMYLQSLK